MAEKSDFNKIIPWILTVEGGYKNNLQDPGGETKYGISKKAYPDLDIKNLTIEKATQIYYTDYYLKYNINLLFSPLDIVVCDGIINQGPTTAIKMLQTLLPVGMDGIIGNQTLDAIKKYDLRCDIITEYLSIRTFRYGLLGSKAYGKGWIRRMFYLQEYILTNKLPNCY